MKISVIIPVYNAAKFVSDAVESALMQRQTAEVILVEDGSDDESLDMCKKLNSKFEKVRLFTHLFNRNRGASTSRNRGIVEANNEWIAFLDADDYYIDGRFDETEKLLSDKDFDAVGSAVGTVFSSKSAKERYLRVLPFKKDHLITTVKYTIDPNRCFWEMNPIGDMGYIHTNGWVIHQDVFNRTGLFNERLRLHQDSDMWTKMSMVASIGFVSINKPLSMRRIHGKNRISKERSVKEKFLDEMNVFTSSAFWCASRDFPKESSVLEQRVVSLWKSNRFHKRDGINNLLILYHLFIYDKVCCYYVFRLKGTRALLVESIKRKLRFRIEK